MFAENTWVFRQMFANMNFGVRNVGDNIGKYGDQKYRTMLFNAVCAVLLATLYHDVDPKHSVISSFQCVYVYIYIYNVHHISSMHGNHNNIRNNI